MKTVIDKAASRGYFNHGWLKTYHTFSFASYFNRNRMGFGKLRVLNDDWVQATEGFGMHQHQDMEVVTIPLKGELAHGDSMVNSRVIEPGDIQVMTTGTGIFHSEYNNSKIEDVEFLQIWVLPKEEGATPRYQDYDIRSVIEHNKLATIIAPDGSAPAQILQATWFSMGTMDAGQVFEYKLHAINQGVYVFLIEGEAKVENVALEKRDGAGFWETDKINIEVTKEAKILLIEVPM